MNTIMLMPFSLKIIYGLIADNLVIFGSRKKAFFIIGGLSQFVALQLIFWINFKTHWPMVIAITIVNT
jgi:hypothetical protein